MTYLQHKAYSRADYQRGFWRGVLVTALLWAATLGFLTWALWPALHQ